MKKGLLLAGLGTALFSCKGILIKLCYQHGLAPDHLIALRMLFSLPFYVLVAIVSFPEDRSELTGNNLARIAAFGFMGYYLASLLDIYGLVYISASLERIILYTYPIMVYLLTVAFLGVGINRRTVACIVWSYAGLLLVFFNQTHAMPDGVQARQDLWLGSLLVLASAFCYSIYLIGTETMTKRIPNRLYTALAMLSACTAMLIHIAIGIDIHALFSQSSVIYGLIFLMAVFCTVLPSFLVSAGIERIGATKAGVVGNIGPLITLLLAVLLLGETINAVQLIGFTIVIAGVFLLTQQKAQQKQLT